MFVNINIIKAVTVKDFSLFGVNLYSVLTKPDYYV